MSITNGYASLADFKAFHSIDSTDATDDGVIESAVEAASRHLDDQTLRTFYARTETRYYSVPEGLELRVDDDLLSITTLTNGDGDAIASSEYYLLPRNDTPKYAIVLKQSATELWVPDANGNTEYVISVLGSWGYASTRPDNVHWATLEMAKAFYARRTGQNMSMVARVTSAGVVLVPQGTPEWVADVIAGYRRRT